MNQNQTDLIEEKIKERLINWIDPEEIESDAFKKFVLNFHYEKKNQSAFALVKYENSIEIDFLFYSPFGDRVELSCDQRIDLQQEEDLKDKKQNQEIVNAVKQVFQTIMRRIG